MIRAFIGFVIKQKLLVALFVLGLIGMGVYSIQHIPLDAVPDITTNQVQVVTQSPSLSAQEVEQFITYPVEIALTNLPNVVEVRSISRFGISLVTVVFEEDVPILDARQFVSEQINLVTGEIPAGYGTPELMPITTGLGEIYQYTLEVDPAYKEKYSLTALRSIQDWVVKRQLSGIPGIIEISSFGGFVKEYEVAVHPEKLIGQNITINDIYSALEKNNQNSGAGYIEKDGRAQYIRMNGLIDILEEINQIVITSRNNIPVTVGDVADVRFGHSNRFGAMTKDGKGEAVGGIALMLKGANSSEAIVNVQNRVAEVQKSLPEGIRIEPYLDRSDLVSKTTGTITKNLVEGGLIVIFVLVLLLGNLRAGIIVSSVIPLSLLFAFIMMRIFGVSANLMSLGAIDFGIVIDMAVIIVEGILHHLHEHHPNQKISKREMNAVIQNSTANMFQSAAFGVLIIIVVFIPILTLEGTEGTMFRPMAQTVSFAVTGAMLLSITYVPMMSSLMLNRNIKVKTTLSDKINNFLVKIYTPSLKGALKKPMLLIGIAVTTLALSVFTFTRMGAEFIPSLEEGDLAMQLVLESDVSLEESIRNSTQAEQIILENFPEVLHMVSKIGTAEVPTDPMGIEDADVMIILKPKDEWVSATTKDELVSKMKEALISGGIKSEVEFSQPIQLRFNELISGTKSDIAVKIFGRDLEKLAELGQKAEVVIKNIEGAGDVRLEQTEGLPQKVITYNRVALAQYGLNVETVNRTVRAAFAGESSGIVLENDRKYNLVVRMSSENRHQVDLDRIYVNSSQGRSIPVSELVYIDEIEGPSRISRDQAQRRIVIGVNVRNRDTESLVYEIEQQLHNQLRLPDGYHIEFGGDFEKLQSAKQRLSIAVPLVLLLILLLLYMAFQKISDALLIFTAIPFAAIGGVFALWVRDMPFSISAGVGFIALFGVAVLNGIVLISRFNQLKEEHGFTIDKVIVDGAISRLRPVVMTASVAAFGFLPMAISVSAGAEVQKPLATVVIGGLITSTLLTLILLPILYMKFHSKSFNASKAALAILVLVGLGSSTQAQTLSLDAAIDSAINNNRAYQNAQLQVDFARKNKQQNWSLGTTDVDYEYGQINEDVNDYFFSIQQNFGNIASQIYGSKVSRALEAKAEADLYTQKAILTRDVKMAYSKWQYAYEKFSIYSSKDSLFNSLESRANLQYEAGEIDLLQKSMAETQYISFLNEFAKAKNELNTAESELMQACYLSNKPDSPTDSLQVKALLIEDSAATLLTESAQMNWELQQRKTQFEKRGFFPEFRAGYFNQRIVNLNNMQGFSVGVSLPLWFIPQKSKVNQLQIQSDMYYNAYLQKELEIEQQHRVASEQATTLSRQLQEAGSKYRTQAQLLQNQSLVKLNAGELDYFQFVQAISLAINAETAYLDLLFRYNQALTQVEFYQSK